MSEITLGVSRFLGYVFVLLDWCRCDLDLWGNEEKYWGVASDWVINDDTLFEKRFVQPFGNQASRKDCRGRTFSWWAQHSCNHILNFLMPLFLPLKMNIYENTRIQAQSLNFVWYLIYQQVHSYKLTNYIIDTVLYSW